MVTIQYRLELVAHLLACSIFPRHGAVPDGRQMFDVSAQETVELARQSDLQVRHVSERQDMFNRNDVSWSIVVLEKTS